MRMQYCNSLIDAYINGEDIPFFNIEDLENDYIFMKQVIDRSNDKKIYYLCSDNLKNNYDFVKYLITKFKDDISFIYEVFNYFYNNTSKNIDIKTLELLVIIDNILSKLNFNLYDIDGNDLKKIIYFKQLLESHYYLIKHIIKEEPKITEQDGLGFFCIEFGFDNSKIISDYFAKRFLNEIFCIETSEFQNKMNFEKFIHFKTKTKPDLKYKNTFIINIVNSYSPFLADYISLNLYLLTDIIKELEQVLKNWDKYILNLNKDRFEIIFKFVDEYTNKNIEIYVYDYLYIVKQIIIKFDLYNTYLNTINETNLIDFLSDRNNEIDEELKKYLDEDGKVKKRFVNKITKLIQKLFRYDYLDDNEKNEYSFNAEINKVLTFRKKH